MLSQAAGISNQAAGVATHVTAGMAGGAVSAAVYHQNIMNGAITGGISAGFAEGVGGAPRGTEWFQGLDKAGQFGVGLASHAAIGAVSGGIAAEMMGGSFGQGAAQGAFTAGFGFIFNEGAHSLLGGENAQFKQGYPPSPALQGDWYEMGWDRCPQPAWCCWKYWLYIPSDSTVIWGGDYRTLTVTMGQMINTGGAGLKFGDTCFAPKPPLPYPWR